MNESILFRIWFDESQCERDIPATKQKAMHKSLTTDFVSICGSRRANATPTIANSSLTSPQPFASCSRHSISLEQYSPFPPNRISLRYSWERSLSKVDKRGIRTLVSLLYWWNNPRITIEQERIRLVIGYLHWRHHRYISYHLTFTRTEYFLSCTSRS